MKKYIYSLIVSLCPFMFLAQIQIAEQNESTTSPFAEKDFLIIASTKNITDAFAFAKNASKKTGFRFRDNKLEKDSVIGATFPIDTCKTFSFEYPCYVARGRYDDGGYISVEYSNAYDGFQKGYFIVVAANGSKDNLEFKEAVKKIKQTYPKSYVKRTKVYLGCMH